MAASTASITRVTGIATSIPPVACQCPLGTVSAVWSVDKAVEQPGRSPPEMANITIGHDENKFRMRKETMGRRYDDCLQIQRFRSLPPVRAVSGITSDDMANFSLGASRQVATIGRMALPGKQGLYDPEF